MVKTNLEYLEEAFPGNTFNLAQPIREMDEVDDLINSNTADEDRFEEEAEEEQDVEEPQKRRRNKKNRNPNNKFEFALVGDSNFKKSGQFLRGVVYRKATCLNSKESIGGLADALNFVVHLNNVKLVVVSALQNIINDEGIDDWKRTITKYVLMISTAATKRPDVQFVVLGPFLRTLKSDHGPLLEPMLDQLCTEFGPVKNISVDSFFKVSASDLHQDGVHLRPRSEARLFAHLKSLFSLSTQRPIAGERSQYPDLRSFLQSRSAPLVPASSRSSSRQPSQQRQSRSVERRYSPGVRCLQLDRQSGRRYSPGVRYPRSDRRSLERRHSPGVRCSRSPIRKQSRSPLVKKIANLDHNFLEMFGKYPDQSIYFAHRQPDHNRSLVPRSDRTMTMDPFPRRGSVKDRLG